MTVSAEPLLREFEALPPDEQESVGHEILERHVRRWLSTATPDRSLRPDEVVRVLRSLGLREDRVARWQTGAWPRLDPAPRTRTLGTLSGQFKVPDDFDAPSPDELLRAFEGDE